MEPLRGKQKRAFSSHSSRGLTLNKKIRKQVHTLTVLQNVGPSPPTNVRPLLGALGMMKVLLPGINVSQVIETFMLTPQYVLACSSVGQFCWLAGRVEHPNVTAEAGP